MTAEEICGLLEERFGSVVVDSVMDANRPYVVLAAPGWREAALFLRDDPRLLLNMLECVTALDLLEDDKLAAVYDLFSVPLVGADAPCPKLRHRIAVRVEVDRNDPHIPSVADVWPAADWHEREAFDLMGIVFDGHPGLERILLPDDWEGFPLRKDYEFPVAYHGIPMTTEFELPNPKH